MQERRNSITNALTIEGILEKASFIVVPNMFSPSIVGRNEISKRLSTTHDKQLKK